MSLLDTILSAQGGAAVQQLGSQLGLGQAETTSALSALVPALAAGIGHQTQSADGLSGLIAALSGGGHSRYMDDPSTLGQASTIDDGNGILGHILGSKDVSRQVASHAAAQTGIGEDVLKKMLPMVATLVMGALARQAMGGHAQGGQSMGGSLGGSMISSIINATLNSGAGGGASSPLGGIATSILGGLFGRR